MTGGIAIMTLGVLIAALVVDGEAPGTIVDMIDKLKGAER